MSPHHLPLLRRLAAAVTAAALGTAVALGASGALHGTSAATAAAGRGAAAPVARAASGGRTARPHLDRGSYLVQAGRRLRVVVYSRGVWGHPRSCQLTVSRGRYDHTYGIHGVVSNFIVVLPTTRDARQGSWKLTVGCTARRQRASRQTSATVLVASNTRARGTLTGRARPDIEPLQAPAPVNTGKYGLGGTPPNPGFPNGQCTYYAYERRPDIYWSSVNNGAPRYGWDAAKWSGFAAQYGHFAEGSTPQVGAVMVEPASPRSWVGHVAYVTQVIDASHWVTQEMNTDGKGVPNKVFTVVNETGPGPAYFYLGGQLHRHVVPGTVFIYGGQAASQQPVSPPQQPTPTTPTPTTPTTGPTTSPTTTGTSAPTTTPTTAPPPTPSTWNETVGGVAHTWTNYTNAGGTEGPR